MWCGTFGALRRRSVANVSMQLWSLVFTFTIVVCAAVSFADTGVYEGDCDSTNTFKDPNTGEAFCYRIARISIEHFKIYDIEWGVARAMCEGDKKLQFGGVQRNTTIVTINSALENEFVRNFVLAEFSKLNKTERELAIPKVLLGAQSAFDSSNWLDESDESYLAYRLRTAPIGSEDCLYMSTVTRGWSVESCLWKGDYEEHHNFSFIACKARFEAPTDGLAVAPLRNFRYDCVPTSEFTDGVIMPNETFCYNVTILPISKGPNYYHNLKRVCEQERSFAHHGEEKPGFLLTLNLEEEDRFVHEVLVKPFLASRMGSVQGPTNISGGLLLGAEGEGWIDGSNSALLRKRYLDYKINSTSCRFLSIVPDRKWIVDECQPSFSFELNVCKARFIETPGGGEYVDMQRQYTGLRKPRRGGARSATLSAVVAVPVVLFRLVNADVF